MAKRLRHLSIAFGSLVDKGANDGARIMLFKRDEVTKRIVERDGEYCVVTQDGSRTLGCHSTHAEAVAQLRAVEANKAAGKPSSADEDEDDDDMIENKETKPMKKNEQATPTPDELAAKVAALETQLGERDATIAELQKAATPPPTDEDVLKALPDSVRKRIEDTERRLSEEIAKADAERTLRVTREYIEKAQAYNALPLDPMTFGPVLKRLNENAATDEDRAELTRVLKAANEIAQQSDLFVEKGRSGAHTDGGAWAQIEAKAEEIRKADGSLTREQAQARAMKDNPELVAAYHAEAN